MATYSEKLRDPRWQRRRLEILQRDDFTCRLCGDKDSTLHVHHLRYEKGADPWEYKDGSLLTVCEACHEFYHEWNFGASIVESCVAGGADLDGLCRFAEALSLQFDDGPDPIRFNTEQWIVLCRGFGALVYAIHCGATDTQIEEALAFEPGDD